MSRHPFLLALVIVFLLVGTTATVLILLVRHEPEFYRRSAVALGKERQQGSRALKAKFVELINDIVNKRQWDARFTDEQFNSYFEEDFLLENGAERILPLPEGIQSPRIALEADKVRLAFRYGRAPWSTVVSLDFRIWLVPKEPNLVAMEFQGLHAGALRVSAQSLLERVYEAARERNIAVNWYRHNGNPVALLHFQADRTNPTFQMQRLELRPGMLVISGRSIDAAPHAVLPTRKVDGE